MIYTPSNIIYNGYKYDINQAIKFFLLYSPNIPRFNIDGITNDDLEHLPKEKYTVLSGKLIKQYPHIYKEFIKSVESFFQKLIERNEKYIKDLDILKVYIDEIVFNKPLVITNIDFDIPYTLKKEFFLVNVFKLDMINRQLYVFRDSFQMRNPFYTTFIVDTLLDIYLNSNRKTVSQYSTQFLIKVLNHGIPSKHLILDTQLLHLEDGKIQKVMNLDIHYKYDSFYYYKYIREILRYLIIAKNLSS